MKQPAGRINAGAIPADQRPHGEGVAEIMRARRRHSRVTRRVPGASRTSTPSDRHEKGRWKIRCRRSPAKKRASNWLLALRWQRLPAFQKLGRMSTRHLDGILNYCHEKVPFGKVEAINSNIARRCGGGGPTGITSISGSRSRRPPRRAVLVGPHEYRARYRFW